MMTPGQTYGDASYSQHQKTDAINAGARDFFGLDKTPSTVVGPGGPDGFGLGEKYRVTSPKADSSKAVKEAEAARKRTQDFKSRQALIKENNAKPVDTTEVAPPAPVLPPARHTNANS